MKPLKWFIKAYRFYCKLTGPVTLGVRAIVVKDDEVLLVKLNYGEGWYLPGGGVKKGESFHQAIVRELREECGIVVDQAKLLHLFFSKKEGKNDHIALFEVKAFSKTEHKGTIEINQAAFFPLKDLPIDLSPATRRRLQEYQQNDFQYDIW